MKKKLIILVTVIISAFLAISSFIYNKQVVGADYKDEIEYVIGVSQANMRETWRVNLINEIRAEAKKHKNIRVIVMDATSSAKKQLQDIDHLNKLGIDMLIVSPLNSDKITKKTQQVYKKIPVIVMDRAVEGFDYSLFIGPDNNLIGKQGGEFVLQLLKQKKGNVLELQSLSESIQKQSRSEGFDSVIDKYKDIHKEVINLDNNMKDSAYDAIYARSSKLSDADVIFAYNDDIALGAYEALRDTGKDGQVKIVSCDGFAGENEGLDMVTKGMIEATITCPTGGKEAVQYALSILNQESGVPKQLILRSRTITAKNVDEYTSDLDKRHVDNKEEITVGFSQVGTESAWRMANTKSIDDAAKEFNIKLITRVANQSQKKQIEAIREFIKLKVDVIVISPVVETGWDEALMEAKEAGIPVIMSDRKIVAQEDLIATYIGADFMEEGRRAMRWIAKNVDTSETPKKIMEIEGNIGASPTEERKAGFEEVRKETKGFEITHTYVGDFTYEGGENAIKDYLKDNKWDIDIIYSQNDDMALGAIKVLEDNGITPGKDVVIVSVDATREAFVAMRKGTLNCAVECNPMLGPQLMKGIRDLVSGKEPPLRIITEEKIYDQSNAQKVMYKRSY